MPNIEEKINEILKKMEKKVCDCQKQLTESEKQLLKLGEAYKKQLELADLLHLSNMALTDENKKLKKRIEELESDVK